MGGEKKGGNMGNEERSGPAVHYASLGTFHSGAHRKKGTHDR